MTILLDYSQVAIGAAFSFSADLEKGKDASKAADILRHTTLSSILNYKKTYGNKFGDMIICVDGKNNWRKKVFPEYKAHRAGARQESKMDWSQLFNLIDILRADLTEVFPYRVICEEEAEGDDVIAVLTKHITENETIDVGIVQEAPPILIVSSDGDFKQLHKHKNVKQWNPLMKKLVKSPEKNFLLEKIVRGDPGDGVPNIRMQDNAIVTGMRQKPITEKFLNEVCAVREAGWNSMKSEQRNFQRNQTLIDFDYIPERIAKSILSKYTAPPKRDLNKIMQYLIKHKCRMLLNDLQSF